MDIRQLQYFVALTKYANFSKAANELHITQPTLSQQISKLEKELGINLFVRSTKEVTITEAGKLLLEYASTIADQWHELNSALGRYVLHESKVFKIAMFPMIKMTNIFDLAREFINENQDYIIEIRFQSVGEILEGIKLGAYDVAFFQDSSTKHSEPTQFHKYSNLLMSSLSKAPMCGLFYYKDALASQTLVEKSQLKGYKIVCEKENSHNSYQRIANVFAQAGVEIGPPIAFTYSPEMIAYLIDRPQRVAFCDASIGAAMVEQYPHLRCALIHTTKQINTYIAARTDNQENKAALKFFHYIQKSL